MRKVRNGLILVATVIIIALCAILPRIYADLQDSVSDEKVEYEDIKTVIFQKDLNIVEKLFLLRDGLRVSVSEEDVSSSADNVIANSYAYMDYLFSCGLMSPYFSPETVSLEPMLFFYSNAEYSSSIFWLVEFAMGDEDYEYEKLSLWVDDQSGVILLCSYETDYQVYEEYQITELLACYYAFYLESTQSLGGYESLSIHESAGTSDSGMYDSMVSSDPDSYNGLYFAESGNEEQYKYSSKKGGEVYTLTIEDEIYGELHLYFYVYTNGFFVSLS